MLKTDQLSNEAGNGAPDFPYGMPTVNGAPIVESGSNTDGKWIRWADGTQVCRNKKRASMGGNLGGLLYLGGTEFITQMAAAFIDNDYQMSVNCSRANGSSDETAYNYCVVPVCKSDSIANRTTVLGPTYRLGSLTTWGSLSADFEYSAVGRWK